MTLNDILVSALAQMDRGHDAKSLDIWRDKLTGFANDAVLDLSAVWRPRRTEPIALSGGGFSVSDLSRDCVKVYAVREAGQVLAFLDEGGGNIRVPLARGAQVEVTYRYVPALLNNPTDVPELPAHMHGLIVTYVVGRERAAGDVSVQRGGNIYFQMYESGKAAIRPHLGDTDSYRIYNRW